MWINIEMWFMVFVFMWKSSKCGDLFLLEQQVVTYIFDVLLLLALSYVENYEPSLKKIKYAQINNAYSHTC